jgi:hypothetical protein
MVGSLLTELSVAHCLFNRMRYADATSVKVNLLDDDIVDTLASVGATSAFTLSFPSTPRRACDPPLAQHIAIRLIEKLVNNARDAR